MDETWPDEILAVTCMRVQDADLVVAGSVMKTCWRCEASVWTSPATLDHVRELPHRFLCMACALHYAAKDKDSKLAPPTAAQLEELRATLEEHDLLPPEKPEARNRWKRNG